MLSARCVLFSASAFLAAMLATGCERPPQPPATDTTVAQPAPVVPDTVVPAPRRTTWDSTAGPALFVHAPAGASGGTLIVTPDADSGEVPTDSTFDVRTLRNLTVEMFTRSGLVGQGQVGQVAEHSDTSSSCALWPTATLTDVPATSSSWAIGFQRGRARAIPVDSIESLASQDSARLAADLTRIASALPNDTATALRGIPFSVQSAYRLALTSRDTAIVAHIIRKLPIEANPLQEHIFLIAERDTSGGRWRPAYFERTSGSEESVETTDALAAVELGAARRPTVILERSGDAVRAFSILERMAPGRWRVRWTSVYTGC